MPEITEPAPAPPAFEAEYALESPSEVPALQGNDRSVQVLRLVRTRVNFISMLPRRGYVVVCPACHQILSAELAGGLTRAV